MFEDIMYEGNCVTSAGECTVIMHNYLNMFWYAAEVIEHYLSAYNHITAGNLKFFSYNIFIFVA